MLLGQRIYEWAEASKVHPLVGGALSAAALTPSVISMQTANLQNDIWLAALVLECLWCLRFEPRALARAAAACALVKMYGFVFAIVSLILARTRMRTMLAAVVPIGLWVVRDAYLVSFAIVPLSVTSMPHIERTTIAYAGLDGVGTLIRAVDQQDFGFQLLFVAAVGALALARDHILRAMTAFAFVIFYFEPFGFSNYFPQLATGQSLRFLLPALFLGIVSLLPLASRLPVGIAIVPLIIAVLGVINNARVFAQDATTHNLPVVVAIAGAIMLIPWGARARIPIALLAMSLVIYATRLAGTHPIDYYSDWLARDGRSSKFFTWLASAQPQRIVNWNLRSGSINVVAPHVAVIETNGQDPCVEARRANALLVASDDPPGNSYMLADRRGRARRCGRVVFDDGTTVVVLPRK